MVHECVDYRHCGVQQVADVLFLQPPVDVKSMDEPVPGFDHSPEFRVQSDDSPTYSPSPAKRRPEVNFEPFAKCPLDTVYVLKAVPPDDDILDGELSFRNGDRLDHLHLARLL